MQRLHGSSRSTLRAALIAAATLWSAAFSDSASSQIPGVDLRTGLESAPEIQAGRPATLSFVVTNGLPTSITVVDEVDSPPGLPTVYDTNPYQLQPGERVSRLVTVMVPRVLEAGQYSFGFRIRTGNGGVSRVLEQRLTVAPKVEVVVERIESSGILRPGETHIATFRLENRGNTVVTLTLEAKATQGLTATPGASSVTLRPGARREVPVSVPIPEKWGDARNVKVQLDAAILHAGTRTLTSSSSEARVVVPRRARLAYHRLPASVSTGAGGLNAGPFGWEPYIHTEVLASGPLRQGGPGRLNLEFRTPTSTSQQASLVQRDRYLMEFSTPGFAVSVGDLSGSSPSLISGSVFGFGAQAAVRLRAIEVNAYRAENRYSFLGETELGGGLQFRPVRSFTAGFHVLDRASSLSPGTAMLFSARVSPGDYLSVAGELGAGTSDLFPGNPKAMAAGVQLNTRPINFSGQFSHADRFYPSNRSNQSSANAFLALRPSQRTTASANYFFSRFGGLGLGDESAPWSLDSHTGLAEIGYDLSTRFRVQGGYDLRGRAVARAGSRAWQHLGFAELTGRFGQLSISGRPMAGLTLPPAADPVPVYGGAVSARVSGLAGRLRLGGSIRHLEGPFGASVAADRNARNSSVSVTTSFGFTARSTLSIAASASRSRFRGYQAHGMLGQFSLDHRFSWGHQIALTAMASQFASGGVDSRPFYEVAFRYTIPLQLPLHRSRDTGLVSGRLVESLSGGPIPDAALFLGSSATLTTADGRFNLPFVEAGEHAFRLQPQQGGNDYVLQDQRQLSVRGGRRLETELVAVRAASLFGTVSIEALRDQGIPEGTAAGVLIRLSGPETRVTVTDGDGAFRFPGLPSGSYVVEIAPESTGGLPVREGRAEVRLAPGERRELSFSLLERRALIQFQPVEAPPPAQTTTPPVPPQATRGTAQSQRTSAASRPSSHTPEARPLGQVGLLLHSVRPGDTLRSLARLYFDGDSEMWAAIYELNRSAIADPNVLSVGTTLRIPPRNLP